MLGLRLALLGLCEERRRRAKRMITQVQEIMTIMKNDEHGEEE
jgi:hypothetical protein